MSEAAKQSDPVKALDARYRITVNGRIKIECSRKQLWVLSLFFERLFYHGNTEGDQVINTIDLDEGTIQVVEIS